MAVGGSFDTFPKLLLRNAAQFSSRPAFRHKDLGIWQTWCACRKSNSDIFVVQPAENWAAKNLPGSFDGTRERRILFQR